MLLQFYAYMSAIFVMVKHRIIMICINFNFQGLSLDKNKLFFFNIEVKLEFAIWYYYVNESYYVIGWSDHTIIIAM